MVEFAGFEMPVQYSSIIEEHLAVRHAVGVFDVTHMGEFFIHGSDALLFLQKVTINDVARLKPGRIQYSAMCYTDGGIIDDLLIYQMENQYMLVVNASNLQKDFDWLQSQRLGDVRNRERERCNSIACNPRSSVACNTSETDKRRYVES